MEIYWTGFEESALPTVGTDGENCAASSSSRGPSDQAGPDSSRRPGERDEGGGDNGALVIDLEGEL